MATNTNRNLHSAATAKKDEFYTQLSDIENELRHYKAHFKGKIIFCNCDDPFESNFFKYFAMNFNSFGLKKLIATCYATSPVTGNELDYYIDRDGQISFLPVAGINSAHDESKRPYRIEITEVTDENGDGRVDLADVEYLLRNKKNVLTLLDGDGDFRSDECVDLLKQADIVVTNPPFSLFREYVAQLVEYEKKFIIIGNKNAITYKEIFPLIALNKLWIGVTPMSREIYFDVPQSYIDEAIEKKKDRTVVKVNGRYMARSQSIWFTNLDNMKRHEDLILYKHYTPEAYPKYDNYDAINVDKSVDIPCDYDGVMGVPITFLDKYNPDQFEIVAFRKGADGKDLVYSFTGSSQNIQVEREREREPHGAAVLPHTHQKKIDTSHDDVLRPVLNGKKIYRRITIRMRRPYRE